MPFFPSEFKEKVDLRLKISSSQKPVRCFRKKLPSEKSARVPLPCILFPFQIRFVIRDTAEFLERDSCEVTRKIVKILFFCITLSCLM